MSLSIALAMVAVLGSIFFFGLGVRQPLHIKDDRLIVTIIPLPTEPPLPPPTEPTSRKRSSALPKSPTPPPNEVLDVPRPVVSIPLSPMPSMPPVPKPSVAPNVSVGSGDNGRGGFTAGNGNAGRAPEFVPASWAIKPSDDFFDWIYPERAKAEGVSGSATLRCELMWNKHVRKCKILSETPPRFGFGRVMLDASRNFRINPPKRNGQVIKKSPIEITLNFELRETGRNRSPKAGSGSNIRIR